MAEYALPREFPGAKFAYIALMTKATTKGHHIWIEQCAAAETIRDKFGLDKALAYLIGEKLFSWLYLSELHPE